MRKKQDVLTPEITEARTTLGKNHKPSTAIVRQIQTGLMSPWRHACTIQQSYKISYVTGLQTDGERPEDFLSTKQRLDAIGKILSTVALRSEKEHLNNDEDTIQQNSA